MSIRILFAGDTFLEEGKVEMDDALKAVLQGYDMKCYNLEAPIVGCDAQPVKKIGPVLRQGDKTICSMKENGFNLIALANNHIMDYGVDGLDNTIKEIEKNGLECFGASTVYDTVYRDMLIEKDGIKVGIINCGENGFGCADENGKAGYAWMLSKEIFLRVAKLKQEGVNVLLAFTHCGLEGINIPLPEWREIFFQFIDAGVDVVINAHPHVPQGWENYKKGRIYYSIGNFIWNKKGQNNHLWSYLVGLEIASDESVIYREHVIESNGERVRLADDNLILKSKLSEFCELICKEQKYHVSVKKIVDECWEKIYMDYAGYAEKILPNDSVKNYFVNIYRAIRKKQSPNLLFLYHNLVIETHLFVMKRYLIHKINPKGAENDL